MSILSSEEAREMDSDELERQMNDLKKELVEERGQIEVGGFAENPGRIGEIKKTVARIKTELNGRK
ncbi:50S ribosomal protein L29 [Nanohaloarchaea archaeon]|jgi:large subunit ribosomal protein L29|nr:50S ribosomal protein L29 [Candidatus Nanohaloarchaea archaeon]